METCNDTKEQKNRMETLMVWSARLRQVGLFAILCLVLVPGIVIPEQARAAETVILAEDSFLPFSDKDGEGLSNEIVVSAFSAVGLDITLKVYPFPRIMWMLKQGKAPGGFNAVPTEDAQEEYIFGKQAIYTTHMRFYYHKDDPVVIDTEDDIHEKLIQQGIIVGEVLGYIYPPAYEALKAKAADAPGLKVEAVKSDEIIIKKLRAHRNRVALMTSEVAEFHIKQMNIEGELKQGALTWEAPLYVAFSKSHPKGEFLSKEFDKGMELIKEDGTYAQILKKYNISQ